ncbi:hypothetical protein CEXT_220941 [Caerostris extrusa]|uniref:Uncharacterized protein n=1 Tax=Caerostris extrusa TaxID=172846 RepID=A0AAV4QXF6_CAEEX|nr:hypothetical protein CEXT_220941 [Caerostris extrusa]
MERINCSRSFPFPVYRPIWAAYSQSVDRDLEDLNAKWRSGRFSRFPTPLALFLFFGEAFRESGCRVAVLENGVTMSTFDFFGNRCFA